MIDSSHHSVYRCLWSDTAGRLIGCRHETDLQNHKRDSVSLLILVVRLDAVLPLFSQQLSEDLVILLLPLLTVFLMTLGVMDVVVVVVPVLLPVVLVVAAPESK